MLGAFLERMVGSFGSPWDWGVAPCGLLKDPVEIEG